MNPNHYPKALSSCFLASVFSGKWCDLSWPCEGPKSNLHYLQDISKVFKMAMLTQKSGVVAIPASIKYAETVKFVEIVDQFTNESERKIVDDWGQVIKGRHSFLETPYLCKTSETINSSQCKIDSRRVYIFKESIVGPFSCDICDIQKDIFEGKPPQNLDFKKQKWKVILNISSTILKKKKESKE